MIKPSIGRKVWYRPGGAEFFDGFKYDRAQSLGPQPFDATIIYVWSDHCVNLLVTDHIGNTFARQAITLAQDRSVEAGECEWPAL